jgi:hypothetical protein
VPFTLSNIKEDLEDLGSRFDGAPDLESRAATKALELEKSGLSYQRVPPGYRFPYGHTHVTSARIRAKTSMASATGGLTSRVVRTFDRLGRSASRRSTSKP